MKTELIDNTTKDMSQENLAILRVDLSLQDTANIDILVDRLKNNKHLIDLHISTENQHRCMKDDDTNRITLSDETIEDIYSNLCDAIGILENLSIVECLRKFAENIKINMSEK